MEARQNTIRDKRNARRKEEKDKKDSEMNDRLRRKKRSKMQFEQWPCPRPCIVYACRHTHQAPGQTTSLQTSTIYWPSCIMQSRLRNAVSPVRCTVLSEIQTLHGRCCLFGECLVRSEPIKRRKKVFLSACQDCGVLVQDEVRKSS